MKDLRDARILVTAFEPWGGNPLNSSQVAVEGLDGQVIGGCLIRVLSLPVRWDEAPQRLLEAVVSVEPSAIVAFGMHPGSAWRVELLAHNKDVRDGRALVIVEDSPRILASGLPVAAILGKMLDAGLPAFPSEEAGTFLCNHVFYWILHAVQEGAAPLVSGFIHVPAPVLDAESGECKNADTLQEGARLTLEAVAGAVGRWRVT